VRNVQAKWTIWGELYQQNNQAFCFYYGYTTPSLAADAAVVRLNSQNKIEVLLVRRGSNPYKGLLSTVGGFVEYNEDPADACLRELKEETNLDGIKSTMKLIGVYGRPDRDPRKHVVSVYYVVQAIDLTALKAGDDAAAAEWLVLDEVLKSPEKIAFDHRNLLTDLSKFPTLHQMVSKN